jgi:hypothetical protein
MSAMMDEVNQIVDPFEGMCPECGPIDANYIPFEDTFAGKATTCN